MEKKAVLEEHLIVPFVVDVGQLLGGLDAVVVDGEDLLLDAAVF